MKLAVQLLFVLNFVFNLSYGQRERNMILPEKTRSVKLNNYDVLRDSNNVTVFVKVLVKPNGKVEEAIVDLARSTTDDAELIGISLKSAHEALFDPGYSTENQWGSIVFTYRLGMMTNHNSQMVDSKVKTVNEQAQGYWQSLKENTERLHVDGERWIFIYKDKKTKEDVDYKIDLEASGDQLIVLKGKRNKREIFEIIGINDQYLSLIHQQTRAINNYEKIAEVQND